MALETVVFQQDPSSYNSCKDFTMIGIEEEEEEEKFNDVIKSCETIPVDKNNRIESPPRPCSSMAQSMKEYCERETKSSSPEVCTTATAAPGRRKRGRGGSNKSMKKKDKEEMEKQRMAHITVERNRRKQINNYLSLLRSFMPPSYSLRGDQASIVGGAINFVKELEQLLQVLEAQKQVKQRSYYPGHFSPLFPNFFTFPQYWTHYSSQHNNLVIGHESMAGKLSTIADIEVSIVERHANIKILSRRQPKQLLKLVAGFDSLGLAIHHLNVTTTVDHMVLYSFNVKVEDDCQLSTVNEIATTVHEMMGKIQEEAMSS
ncbi:unnamed protein product [Camellia sinensis]